MEQKKSKILFLVMICITGLYTLLVQVVDVKPIGPQNTEVGFATINGAIHETFGIHMFWYEFTKYMGVLAILIVGVFGLIGVMQLIQRRSLKEVDGYLYCLAGLYVALGLVYVIFEKAIVNYRPIIMPDEVAPEASFPSSHTMLICTILGSTILVLKNVAEDTKYPKLCQGLIYVAWLFIILTVFGRLYCGVHWFTDIVGGVLYSVTLILAFCNAIARYEA